MAHKGKINVIKFLIGKYHGKTAHGRYDYRQEDNIKMNLREISWGDMN
jgi:hypothetical protein